MGDVCELFLFCLLYRIHLEHSLIIGEALDKKVMACRANTSYVTKQHTVEKLTCKEKNQRPSYLKSGCSYWFWVKCWLYQQIQNLVRKLKQYTSKQTTRGQIEVLYRHWYCLGKYSLNIIENPCNMKFIMQNLSICVHSYVYILCMLCICE